MLKNERQIIEQLDEMTKRVNNLELALFITTMAQAECEQPSADKINKSVMKMFFNVSRSFGQFKSWKEGTTIKIRNVGMVFKNGDKI